ncbi:hypothetical protein LZ554_003344 [Drepanopeziza brunnea f. sp. 'monogermtubi']|nr:hypothetical protein LZ554_003344 [Drepanopeziza brunnea f. sp. 'monogermtubi']
MRKCIDWKCYTMSLHDIGFSLYGHDCFLYKAHELSQEQERSLYSEEFGHTIGTEPVSLESQIIVTNPNALLLGGFFKGTPLRTLAQFHASKSKEGTTTTRTGLENWDFTANKNHWSS